MDEKLIASVVSALVSAAGAIWTLSTAHRARLNVLRADETAKRAELVRVKALEAVDELLKDLTTMILAAETMNFLLREGVDPQQPLKDYGQARGQVSRLRYRFAPYASDGLLSHIDEIVLSSSRLETEPTALVSHASKLRQLASRVASEARATYLIGT